MDNEVFRQTQRTDGNVYAFRRLKWGGPRGEAPSGRRIPFWVMAVIVAGIGFGGVYVATSSDGGVSNALSIKSVVAAPD